MAQTLQSLKIAYIFIIIGIAALGIIPILCKQCKNNTNILSIMNTFAAGVFLSMAFVHILPEAAESYNKIMEEKQL